MPLLESALIYSILVEFGYQTKRISDQFNWVQNVPFEADEKTLCFLSIYI